MQAGNTDSKELAGKADSIASPRVSFYHRFSGRLFVLLMLVVIPALAATLYENFRERQNEKARLSERALAIASLEAANQESFLRNARQLFDTLAQFSSVLLTTNRSLAEAHFANLRKLLPDYTNFGLIESNGMVFCSADPYTNAVYLGDREYFKRVLRTKAFSVGEFQISRLTKIPVVNLACPVLDEQGRLVRVMFASLKLSHLCEAIDNIHVPEQGAIELMDRAGTVLARHAEADKWIGRRVFDDRTLQAVLARQSGVFESHGSNGIPRLLAVSPVGKDSSASMFVSVEVPLKVLFAQADYALGMHLLVMGLIVAALFAVVHLYARRNFLAPIASLAAAAERLAAGNLDARAGVKLGAAELVQLGAALDTMAERVGARTVELVHTNQALRGEIVERERAEKLARQREEEKHKLEEQVLRSQRMESLGALAGGVAHDLNNALVPVIMGSEMLRERGDDPAARRVVLDLIASSGQRCTALVKQILTFAKGSAGQAVSVPVRHLVDEMAGIARDTFPKNIRVRASAPKDLWSVNGNATELHQVVLNLCVNARDAMTKGGELALSAENLVPNGEIKLSHPDALEVPYVVITVSDTGTGIPPELRERVFEPFFTTKPADQGTGLGLSTVASIVKRHQGFVELESEAGKGTRFKVYLPAAPIVPVQAPEANRPPLPFGHGELVLFVDDEHSVLELGKSTLENYGYRLLTAANGLEAITCFELHKTEIKLLVMDTDMPFLDGVSALRSIREVAPDLPLIMASATDPDTALMSQRERSGVLFLKKPYGVEDLVRSAAKALRSEKGLGADKPAPAKV
jgi:signal transduction histidine kinase